MVAMTTMSRPLAGGPGVFAYLTGEDPDAREYYMARGSGHGEVWGAGARRLGLEQITRDQFDQLAQGRSLDGTTQLIQTQGGKHSAGIDVTFAPPKSVSEALITATPEEREAITTAFVESVKVGFARMEQEARVARVPVRTPELAAVGGRATKTQGSATERVSAELIGFVATHHTARPTPETVERGSPPDPHLHVHVFVFNQAWVPDANYPAGGKWRAVDDWGIKRQAEERDAEVMGEFARRLENLGYRLDYHETKKGQIRWELAGSDPNVRQFFSTNSRRAEGLARELERKLERPATDAELRDALRMSRLPKDRLQEWEPRWGDWADAAARAGVKLQRYEPELGRVPPSAEVRLQELRDRLASPSGLCRDDATFTAASVRPTVARCAVGLGFTPDELADFSQRFVAEELVHVRSGHTSGQVAQFTTPENLERERFVLAVAQEKADTTLVAPTPGAIGRAIEASPVELDHEQVEAVKHVCDSRGWTNVEGLAGTGKTTLLKVAVAAYQDREDTGYPAADQIVVVSTAAATAERTAEKLGVRKRYSLDGFSYAVDKGVLRPTERTVVFVDEAAMVDTAREAAFLKAAGPARIVNVGDARQLQPIGAGGWYPEQARRIGQVQLTRVHRQKDPADIEALRQIRFGQAKEALANFTERGRFHVTEDRSQRLGQVLAHYRGFRDKGYGPGEVRVVIEATNHEVDTTNRLIQYDRQARGELRGKGFEVRANDEGRSWTIYEGDQVMLLETYRHDTYQRPLRNGKTGTVLALQRVGDGGRAVVRLDEGGLQVINLTAERDTQHLGLAYAVHANKFQGHEAKIVQVVPGSREMTSLESAYSTTSRAVNEIHVYADRQTHGPSPADSLALAWQAPDPKRMAMSQMEADPSRRQAEERAPTGPSGPPAPRITVEHFEPSRLPAERDWELATEPWERRQEVQQLETDRQTHQRRQEQRGIDGIGGLGIGD